MFSRIYNKREGGVGRLYGGFTHQRDHMKREKTKPTIPEPKKPDVHITPLTYDKPSLKRAGSNKTDTVRKKKKTRPKNIKSVKVVKPLVKRQVKKLKTGERKKKKTNNPKKRSALKDVF